MSVTDIAIPPQALRVLVFQPFQRETMLDQPMAVDFARAICVEGRFKIYRGDGSNDLEQGFCSAEQAVASGRPYLGSGHPGIWAVDIDNGDHPAVDSLRGLLDQFDLGSIECMSGGGEDHRHLFVRVGNEVALRDRIIDEVCRLHPQLKGVIDWRLQRTGSAIRPPLAPHRLGGRSEPMIDAAEALSILQGWTSHDEQTGLPGWCHAYLDGDWVLAERFGKVVPRRSDGDIDRSAVDISIALAVRNSGGQYADYVALRATNGTYPSPKALALGLGAAEYLYRQWTDACTRPMPLSRVRAGLDRLDELVALIDADRTLKRPDRLVLNAIVSLARRYKKTSIALSYRQIVEAGGGGIGSVHRVMNGGRIGRYLTAPTSPNENDWQQTPQYRLLVLEALGAGRSELEQSCMSTGGVIQDCSKNDLPDCTHPVFSNRPGGLRSTGYQTALCFDSSEARTASEAFKLAIGVGSSAFKQRLKALKEHGVLIPAATEPRRLRLAAGFDWDGLAADLGLGDLTERLADRHNQDRRRYNEELYQRKKISAKELVDRTSRLAARPVARARPQNADSTIDIATGEILDASVAPALPAPPQPAVRVRPCRCCGSATQITEATTGLPWHKHCLMPAWVAKIEERRGIKIPDGLIQRPTRMAANDSEWFTGERSSGCGERKRERTAA